MSALGFSNSPAPGPHTQVCPYTIPSQYWIYLDCPWVHRTIPSIGLLALAYNRFSIRPAEVGELPDRTASFMASAISPVFPASAIAVFIRTPSIAEFHGEAGVGGRADARVNDDRDRGDLLAHDPQVVGF